MKPGESVQIKTPNAMAGVRGTVVIADVALPADGTPLTTRFTLLTGIVDVSRVDAGTGPAGQPVCFTAAYGCRHRSLPRGLSAHLPRVARRSRRLQGHSTTPRITGQRA